MVDYTSGGVFSSGVMKPQGLMSWFPILTQLLMLNPSSSLQDQLGGESGSWRDRQAGPGTSVQTAVAET